MNPLQFAAIFSWVAYAGYVTTQSDTFWLFPILCAAGGLGMGVMRRGFPR